MSYSVQFECKLPIGNGNYYTVKHDTGANTTYNLKPMIIACTGLNEWESCGTDLGLCKDVIEKIEYGLAELYYHAAKYEQYNDLNGWGTVEGCRSFLHTIVDDWHEICTDQFAEIYKLRDMLHFIVC